jgi:hypothetical protein
MEFAALAEEANNKGMVLVNSDETEALLNEGDEKVQEADDLCEIVDPESKPFESKYKAREILDKYLQRLEAARTVSRLEGKSEQSRKLSEKIASLQVKVGGISWDCEEPHNAQKDLEPACDFYYPELNEQIRAMVGQMDDVGPGEDTIVPRYRELTTPTLCTVPLRLLVDSLKCLNLLGILWAGRGQPHKSLVYLLCAEGVYKNYRVAHPRNHPTATFSSNIQEKDMENSYTHTLFYLAQAYGNLRDTDLSSQYCQETLQRQLSNGLKDVRTALEWVKNCAGIADFYRAMDDMHRCALALASAEKLLKEKVIRTLYNDLDRVKVESSSNNSASAEAADRNQDQSSHPLPHQRPNFVQGNLNAAEIEADLHRRWASLDVLTLQRAAERRKEHLVATEMGIDALQIEAEEKSSTEISSSSAASDTVELFQGLPIANSVLALLNVREISSFDSARSVFLRAVARVEAAKKYYVLDGYVTDHVTLLQEHSKLYHHLALFESDPKRKLAMETRRLEMLAPVLKSLNKISFEVLHKQVSYELGETCLALLDIKLDKLRHRDGQDVVNEKALKKSEIMKINEYCKTGYAMFAHFGFMYAQSKDRNSQNCLTGFETLPLHTLVGLFCAEPDEALITLEEVRPFLNASFLSCRIVSKIIAHPLVLPSDRPADRAHYLVACLHRYEWLVRFAPRICDRRGVALTDIFGEEYQICQDMVKLLPSKIDRMCYMGESGLGL